ncbi:hypothetical protein JTB14_034062 [Gonioctena quinquepunctata]|nr:hypothetical protein JTB14_034062 [Gonioctena quinquepunctata]
MFSIYRSPTGNFQNFLDKLEMLLNEVFSVSSQIWLSGDFNIDFSTPSEEAYSILNITEQFGLRSIVHDYTRITSHSSTKIDNIFTNVQSISLVVDTPISDHRLIITSVKKSLSNFAPAEKSFTFKRIFSNNDKHHMAELLDWVPVYKAKSCDDNDKLY